MSQLIFSKWKFVFLLLSQSALISACGTYRVAPNETERASYVQSIATVDGLVEIDVFPDDLDVDTSFSLSHVMRGELFGSSSGTGKSESASVTDLEGAVSKTTATTPKPIAGKETGTGGDISATDIAAGVGQTALFLPGIVSVGVMAPVAVPLAAMFGVGDVCGMESPVDYFKEIAERIGIGPFREGLKPALDSCPNGTAKDCEVPKAANAGVDYRLIINELGLVFDVAKEKCSPKISAYVEWWIQNRRDGRRCEVWRMEIALQSAPALYQNWIAGQPLEDLVEMLRRLGSGLRDAAISGDLKTKCKHVAAVKQPH
jgi:hypothetical protein